VEPWELKPVALVGWGREEEEEEEEDWWRRPVETSRLNRLAAQLGWGDAMAPGRYLFWPELFFSGSAVRAGDFGTFVRAQPVLGEDVGHGDGVFEIQGLDEEGVGAEGVGTVDVADGVGGGENHDAQGFERGLYFEPAKNFESVEARHFEVEEKQVREWEFGAIGIFSSAEEIADGLVAVADDENGVGNVRYLEGFSDKQDIVFPIFRQKYYRSLRHRNILTVTASGNQLSTVIGFRP